MSSDKAQFVQMKGTSFILDTRKREDYDELRKDFIGHQKKHPEETLDLETFFENAKAIYKKQDFVGPKIVGSSFVADINNDKSNMEKDFAKHRKKNPSEKITFASYYQQWKKATDGRLQGMQNSPTINDRLNDNYSRKVKGTSFIVDISKRWNRAELEKDFVAHQQKHPKENLNLVDFMKEATLIYNEAKKVSPKIPGSTFKLYFDQTFVPVDLEQEFREYQTKTGEKVTYELYMKLWRKADRARQNIKKRVDSSDESAYESGSSSSDEEVSAPGEGKGRGGEGKEGKGKGKGAKSQSRSSRAGLQFPVGRIARFLRKSAKDAGRISPSAPVYLAAVLEYLAAEILELSGNAARDNKRTRIKERHLQLAVRNDEELNKLLGGVTIAGGGVLPNIHNVLLPKKRPKTGKEDGAKSPRKEKTAKNGRATKKPVLKRSSLEKKGDSLRQTPSGFLEKKGSKKNFVDISARLIQLVLQKETVDVQSRPTLEDCLDTRDELYDAWLACIKRHDHIFPYTQEKSETTSSFYDVTKDDLARAAIESGPAVAPETLQILAAVIAKAKTAQNDPDVGSLAAVLPWYASWTKEKIVTRLLRSRVEAYFGSDNRWNDIRMNASGIGEASYTKAIQGKLEDYLLPGEGPLAALFAMRFSTRVFNDMLQENKAIKRSDGTHVQRAFVYGVVGTRLEVNDGEKVGDYPILSGTARNLMDKVIGDELSRIFEKITSGASYKVDLFASRYIARTYVVMSNVFHDLQSSEQTKNRKFVVRLMKIGLGVWGKTYLHAESNYRTGLLLAIRDCVRKDGPIVAIENTRLKQGDLKYDKELMACVAELNIPIKWNVTSNMLGPLMKSKYPSATDVAITFAWDGMSLPGNEYWAKDLDGSMDPATACATDIPFTGVGFLLPGIYVPTQRFKTIVGRSESPHW